MVPPRKTEAEVWREKAEAALGKFTKAMEFFMFATAQLVQLSSIHAADDFNHCTACKVPWPCNTMKTIQKIGLAWEATQKEVK